MAGGAARLVHLTRALDERLRRAEVDAIRTGIDAAQRLYPELQAEGLEIAGGIARYAGVDALSEAFGVGALAPVSPDEVARISEFYETRGATPRVYVTPLTDPSLARELAAAGFLPVEYQNVLVSQDFEPYARFDARVSLAADFDAWALASMRGFTHRESPEPGDARIAMILAASEGVRALEGRDGGAIVATAAMSVRSECASFFAGSTLPELRRSGWHLALIRDRIARARDAGASLMRATAEPGSASERNFRRCGFVTLYTRSLWARNAGSAEPGGWT